MLEVKNVTLKYGEFIAVDDLSFEVNKGEIFGLLGTNGAGKRKRLRSADTYNSQCSTRSRCQCTYRIVVCHVLFVLVG